MNGLEILYCECPEFREDAVDWAVEYLDTSSPEFAMEWLESSWTPKHQGDEFDWLNSRGVVE